VQHPISIAYDDWNVWFRAREAETALEERYTLADALAVATYLNIFIRSCESVKIANLAQLVNVIAPIFTNKEGLFLQTIYHPLRLYSQYMLDVALDAFVDCETYTQAPEKENVPWLHRMADLGPFKFLDVSVTRDATGHELAIAVVNRDRERAHETTIQLTDALTISNVSAYEVNGAAPDVINSFAQPAAVSVREHALDIEGHSFTYSFPAHSVTVLRAHVE